MSDSLPFEIQVEIINRLPVKSLIQFRSVCKSWQSLIDSSDFISGYSGHHTHPQHILVRFYDDSVNYKYVSIVDDNTFPQQTVSVTPPLLVSMLKFYIIIGSSHGLFCLYGFDHEVRDGPSPRTSMAIIWNISIRKAVAVVVPNVGDGLFRSVLGFGICRETIDPKIVKIAHINRSRDMESISCIPPLVEVFTLSTGAWRSPYNNLPRKSIDFDLCSVSINGFLYWLATDATDGNTGAFGFYNLIISFDLTSEEFREVNLPDSLARHQSDENLHISKLRSTLVVLEHDEQEKVFVVWMMEDNASKSLMKLFTIYTPDATVLSVLEFRKNGEPVIEVVRHCAPHDGSSLAVYEPNSKHINNLEINGGGSFYVFAYMGTLLLLDQPNFIIYDKN